MEARGYLIQGNLEEVLLKQTTEIYKFRQVGKCCRQWNIFKVPEAKESRESSRNWKMRSKTGTRRAREIMAKHEPGEVGRAIFCRTK